ncbi:MFS transporter [bacterium]|nr:MAG: MFS transporter [bacterium]
MLAPFLGAIADRGGSKKRFLGFFASVGVLATLSLFLIPKGEWPLAALAYATAMAGFMGGNIFYDSLLVSVSRKEDYDFSSALGFSLGYLGGGLLFSLNIFMVLKPGLFGMASAADAVRFSFLLVAVWWGIFSLPLLMLVKERKSPLAGRGHSIRKGLRDLAETFRHIRGLKPVLYFLIAYWLYIDGVDTIIVMAVDYGLSLGFSSSDLMTALLITQFVGFPSAIAFGRLGERFGVKKALSAGLLIYCGVIFWGYKMDSAAEFYALAVIIGLAQGGVQALSRSYYARLIPKDRSAQFFGFYNMLGKFAAVLGPVLMGWVSVATRNPRVSILSLLLLIGGGLVILNFTKAGAVEDSGGADI